ncbi:hypothetical protein Tco_0471219 [Tanacetum coccineum]
MALSLKFLDIQEFMKRRSKAEEHSKTDMICMDLVDHRIFRSYPMNEFATHQIPQLLGNMNGWLIELMKKKLREMKWTRTLSLLPVASRCGRRPIKMIVAMHLIIVHGVPSSCVMF